MTTTPSTTESTTEQVEALAADSMLDLEQSLDAMAHDLADDIPEEHSSGKPQWR